MQRAQRVVLHQLLVREVGCAQRLICKHVDDGIDLRVDLIEPGHACLNCFATRDNSSLIPWARSVACQRQRSSVSDSPLNSHDPKVMACVRSRFRDKFQVLQALTVSLRLECLNGNQQTGNCCSSHRTFYGIRKRALSANDVDTIDKLFWNSPLTLRYGPNGTLIGHAALRNFAAARKTLGIKRTLHNTIITTFGSDFAVANTE